MNIVNILEFLKISTEPTKLRMFKNKEGLTFDDVNSGKADQDIDLVTDPRGDVQYPLKTTKFNNVHHLSLFFPESKGGDQTKVNNIKIILFDLEQLK